MGATWQIRLNDLCSAAMLAVATVTIATCSRVGTKDTLLKLRMKKMFFTDSLHEKLFYRLLVYTWRAFVHDRNCKLACFK